MTFHTWFLFALAYLLTTISPGPNVLLVIRNTVRYGKQGAVASVCGNLLSQGVVVVLVALGVGTLLRTLPPLFLALKVAGAAYLIYLGIRQFRSKASSTPTSDAKAAPTVNFSSPRVFREAFLVSVSNPKTMIFLSAFMPQFVSNDRPLAPQFILMYLTIACAVGIVHAIYSQGAARVHQGLAAKSTLLIQRLKRLSGLVFVGLGIKLLTAKV